MQIVIVTVAIEWCDIWSGIGLAWRRSR